MTPKPPIAADVAVLVVDDDEDHRELLVRALSRKCDPARIVTVASGLQALDFLLGRGDFAGRNANKQPRLVILDLRMTPMSGLEVIQAMRGHPLTVPTPVVVVSSSTDKAALDRCYKAGANSVVRKEVDFDAMADKMAMVYDFWITVNEANRSSRV